MSKDLILKIALWAAAAILLPSAGWLVRYHQGLASRMEVQEAQTTVEQQFREARRRDLLAEVKGNIAAVDDKIIEYKVYRTDDDPKSKEAILLLENRKTELEHERECIEQTGVGCNEKP